MWRLVPAGLALLLVAVAVVMSCSYQSSTANSMHGGSGNHTPRPSGESPSTVLRVARSAAGDSTFEWTSTQGRVDELLFSPNDIYLAIVLWFPKKDDPQPFPGRDNTRREVIVLSFPDAREVLRLDLTSELAMAFSPDDDCLAILGDELTLWDIQTRTIQFRIERDGLDPQYRTLGFTVAGDAVACAGEFLDPKIEQAAWSTTSGERTAEPHDPIVWSDYHISPDAQMFWSGGWPGPTPRIYKTDRSARITYCFRDKWPVAAAFTSDSKNLVSVHEDGKCVVWEIKETDNENARQLASADGFVDCVALALAHKTRHAAIATTDGSVRLFEVPQVAE